MMRRIPTKPIQTIAYCVMLSLLPAAGIAFAQDQGNSPPPNSAPSPGWHNFSNPPEPRRTTSRETTHRATTHRVTIRRLTNRRPTTRLARWCRPV